MNDSRSDRNKAKKGLQFLSAERVLISQIIPLLFFKRHTLRLTLDDLGVQSSTQLDMAYLASCLESGSLVCSHILLSIVV